MGLDLRLAYNLPEQVGELFAEYTDFLIAADPAAAKVLKSQHYEEELKHLKEKYGLPDGRLYLAYLDGELAGCGALKNLDGGRCEIKRIYVRPRFRGRQIGEALTRQIICDAKEIGYQSILLDTFAFLKSAIGLYEKYGFYQVECYNDNPLKEAAVYMRLDLGMEKS